MHACTTAVISGKATPDGRPLLWKHRDSNFEQNKLMFFKDGRYPYIALVNSADTSGKEVWGGCNSAGFAIINSASYNLKPAADTTAIKDREGVVMKQALQQCASVTEFEQFLIHYPRPMGVEANFGVIDADGNGAYFETGNFSFRKFDVNDPATAPHGYILRTNYSYTGMPDSGYGYIRYASVQEYFNMAEATSNLSLEFILNGPTRSFKHGITGINFLDQLPRNSGQPCFVNFDDMILRNSSTSSVIIQGVRAGEPLELTTMWTVLGFQFCSVAVPVWVSGGEPLPAQLTANEKQVAPLCDMALKLKEKCYPVKRGSGYKYLNLAAVANQSGDGIFQQLQPLEKMIRLHSAEYLKKWRQEGINHKDIHQFYQWLDETITDHYKNKKIKNE